MMRRYLVALLLLASFAARAQISTPTAPTAAVNNNNSHASLASGSFTPTGSALVIACSAASGANQTFTNFTSTFATGGWTTAVNSAVGGTGEHRVTLGWAIATATPGAGTVQTNWGANVSAGVLFVVEIDTGFDTSTPIAQTDSATAASGTSLADNFAAAPDTTSMLVACGIGGDDNFGAQEADAHTGWILLEQFVFSGQRKPNTQYDTGTTLTAYGVSFGAVDASTGIAIAAVEVQDPAAGGSGIPKTRGLLTVPFKRKLQ